MAMSDTKTNSFWRRRWLSLGMLAVVLGFAFCDVVMMWFPNNLIFAFSIKEGSVAMFLCAVEGQSLMKGGATFELARPSLGGAPDFGTFEGGFSFSVPLWLLAGLIALWMAWREWRGRQLQAGLDPTGEEDSP
jgi:hypothetical protein